MVVVHVVVAVIDVGVVVVVVAAAIIMVDVAVVVLVDPRNLNLKFGQNWVSNC